MTVHRIMAPDVFAGREPRLILWDDETGEVSGEHSAVAHLNATLERIERDDGYLRSYNGHWTLRDPRRNPSEFKAVLYVCMIYDEDLPAPLRDVETAPILATELAPGRIA